VAPPALARPGVISWDPKKGPLENFLVARVVGSPAYELRRKRNVCEVWLDKEVAEARASPCTRSTSPRTDPPGRRAPPPPLRPGRLTPSSGGHDDSGDGMQKLSAGSADPIEEEKAMPSVVPRARRSGVARAHPHRAQPARATVPRVRLPNGIDAPKDLRAEPPEGLDRASPSRNRCSSTTTSVPRNPRSRSPRSDRVAGRCPDTKRW
jgi:hypothetical protein